MYYAVAADLRNGGGMKKAILAAMLAAVAVVQAQAAPAVPPIAGRQAGLAGAAVFSDPGYQEFIETSYGYLNKRGSLRDSLNERAAFAARPEGRPGYVFVSLQPKIVDSAALLERVQASAGFILSGERVCRRGGVKVTCLIGWVPAASLKALKSDPLLAKVTVERSAASL